MMITSCHTNACFDAWVNCEQLLASIAQIQQSISRKISKLIDECAFICMGTFHALKTKSCNMNRYAVLCVGICEECAEVCEQLNDQQFKQCAKVCRECSETLTAIAFSNLQ